MKTIVLEVVMMFAAAFLSAERGIIVAANDLYAKGLLGNVKHLRENLRCCLPIEVWHAGDELSPLMQERLLAFDGVTICDVVEKRGGDPKRYRGWQIKAYMLGETHFDEVLLMDADVIFFENPEMLFDDPDYQRTGTFFFRDCRWSYMTQEIWKNSYTRLDDFFRNLIESPSDSMPIEWRHHWEGFNKDIEHPIVNIYQEAGCLAFNKKRHVEGLKAIVVLNEEYETVYQYVYGDKETYWMGLEMAKEPYYVNDEVPWAFRGAGHRIVPIVQFVKGKLFYQQKQPIRPWPDSIFSENFLGTRPVTEEEKAKIYTAYVIYQRGVR